MAGALAGALLTAAAAATTLVWPSPKYRDNPVGYFREILGVEPWSRQIQVCNAVRDFPRVAVSSGHKVSKSHTAAGLALWYFDSFEDARVVMSSTTARQVDQILWREVRMMHARSGICATCKAEGKRERPCPHSQVVDGEPRELARSGLKSPDFREVVGFTAREAEAVAGISGKNLLYILDEASGIPDVIFEAIEGNRAGGARIVMFSNPTRTAGEFFEAFYSKAPFYHSIRISSEETPNVIEGKDLIPGLATRGWIEEKRLEWGADSALYKIRVKGEHVLSEDGKILSVHAISSAEDRWDDTPYEGRLFIGIDPAGPGTAGDETVFAIRRGKRVGSLLAMRGQTEEAILTHTLGLVKEHKHPRETPCVVLDREGPIGSRIFGLMRSYLDTHPGEFELLGVRASDKASREPAMYDRVRDELWANLAKFLSDENGGALPEDTKLAKELHEPSWVSILSGKLKVTPKEDMRKVLGRSPDRADAVALCVWEPLVQASEQHEQATVERVASGGRRDDDGDSDDLVYGHGDVDLVYGYDT